MVPGLTLSIIPDQPPQSLPQALVDLLASGLSFPALHPPEEAGGDRESGSSDYIREQTRQYKYICNSYQGTFIAHSFEYTAPSDMVCDAVPKSTQTLHVHRKNKACRILQITGEPNPYLDPCNGPVLQ